jgi:tetratricopeptide (TPR) repeat protein
MHICKFAYRSSCMKSTITALFLCFSVLSGICQANQTEYNNERIQSQLTLQQCDSIKNEALSNIDYGGAITCLLDMARIQLRKGVIDSAMISVFEARNLTLNLEEKVSLHYSARCNQMLGEIFYSRYIDSEALGFCLLALQQFRLTADIKGVAEVLNAITLICISLEKYNDSQKALVLLSKVENISSDPYIKALYYEAAGDYSDATGDYDNAIHFFRKAQHFYFLSNKPDKISDVYLSRAISESSKGKTDRALEIVDSTLALNSKSKLRKNYLEAMYYKAQFTGENNPIEGIKILNSVLEELGQLKLNIHLGSFLKLMVHFQKETGDYRGALESTERFHMILDQIYGSDAERKIAQLQLEVETEKLNHNIIILQKESELISVNSRSQRNMLFYFFLAIIVLFTMALNNMRKLQYRLYLLKEFALDFPLPYYLFAFLISLLYYSTILIFVNPLNLVNSFTGIQWVHYGLIGFIISALTTAGVFMLPTHWSAKPGFNSRFAITALLFLLFINIVVVMYAFLSGVLNHSWLDYMNIILVVTGITIIPLFFIIIYLEKVLLRKHIQMAGILSSRIHAFHPKESVDLIEIYSDRSKDVLNIPADNLLMIEAAGNYAKICYTEDNKTKTTLILATLKLIESQLENHQNFSRCHKSYIINLKKVKKVVGNSHGYKLEIPGIEDLVPVSRSYAETFIKTVDKVCREN